MDLSLAVRIGERACSLHEKISVAGDGIVVSEECLERSDVRVVYVGAQGESAVAGEMAMLERDSGVEFGGSVIPAQGCVVKSYTLKGKLEGSGKRIPLGLERVRLCRSGQRDVKIVGLQTSGELR